MQPSTFSSETSWYSLQHFSVFHQWRPRWRNSETSRSGNVFFISWKSGWSHLESVFPRRPTALALVCLPVFFTDLPLVEPFGDALFPKTYDFLTPFCISKFSIVPSASDVIRDTFLGDLLLRHFFFVFHKWSHPETSRSVYIYHYLETFLAVFLHSK